MFRAIGRQFSNAIFASAQRPSYTAVRTSAIVTGHDKLTRWKRELSSTQISNILSVVDAFELGYVYGDSSTPLIAGL